MYSIYWGGVIAAAIIGLYYTGRRKQLQMKSIDDKVLAEAENGELIGRLIYHGGMPQMPKPSSLTVGILPDSLLLWNYHREKTSVDFESWIKCEKLTMEQRPNTRGLLVTLLGPLIFLFTRRKLRYFLVIKYLDCNGEENNILFECPGEANQQHVYDMFHDRWQESTKQRPREGTVHTVAGEIERGLTCRAAAT